MTQQDLIQILRRRPFQPIRLHLDDGAVYEIRHPELVIVTPSVAIIGIPAAAVPIPGVVAYETISLFHVSRVEHLEAPSPPAAAAAS